MTNEFIFGTLEKASAYAKSQCWKNVGRGQWEKPDGTCVHLITFLEQFEALHRGQRIYALRKLDALESRTLKNLGAEVVNWRAQIMGRKKKKEMLPEGRRSRIRARNRGTLVPIPS